MKRRLFPVLAMMMVFLMTACSMTPPAATQTDSGDDDSLVIGYSLFDFANPYFIKVTDGMKSVCEEEGIELIVHDAKSDVAAQVAAVEGFIAQQVDAIILSHS